MPDKLSNKLLVQRSGIRLQIANREIVSSFKKKAQIRRTKAFGGKLDTRRNIFEKLFGEIARIVSTADLEAKTVQKRLEIVVVVGDEHQGSFDAEPSTLGEHRSGGPFVVWIAIGSPP
jgi:hypothetical protein